jgi:predicted TIM-barrel fold metal-dependent hydrolase
MIDTHLHVVPPRLPGVGILGSQLALPPEQVAGLVCREMREAGIHAVLAMGSCNNLPDDPLGVNATLAIAELVPGLHAIGVMDPAQADADHLRRVEKVLGTGKVKALKGYLGYLHYPPDHAGYRPYYELAERYKIPVVFHTGDTYSASAKVRFAHPLLVDDVAVDHPRTNFVLAHFGNPWMQDAAEVVYKNLNVWADLSALVIGKADVFTSEDKREMIQEVKVNLGRAFRYTERPNRFLFGSDWPLVPIAPYREFIAGAIPQVYHDQVFEENAQRLFKI